MNALDILTDIQAVANKYGIKIKGSWSLIPTPPPAPEENGFEVQAVPAAPVA